MLSVACLQYVLQTTLFDCAHRHAYPPTCLFTCKSPAAYRHTVLQ